MMTERRSIMKITKDTTVEEVKEKTKDTMIGMCFIEGSKQEKQTLAEVIRKQTGISNANQAMNHSGMMQTIENGTLNLNQEYSQESVLMKVKK